MRRALARGLALIVLLGLAGSGAFALWLRQTTVSVEDLPPLRSGDILFQESGSGQTMAIALASRSLYTHTGIVEMHANGQAYVVEAAQSVQSTPLGAWIARGTAGRITVKRVRGLSEESAKKVLSAAHTYDGRPYDFFFHEDAETIYCSELVRRAFDEGAGIELGHMQSPRDLDIDNAAVRKIIEARWRKHPLCLKQGAASFDACYKIILDQRLVTPAAIARDGQLETLFTNFSIAAD